MGVSENDYDPEEEEICDFDDNHYHQYHNPQLPHTLSRLSICTSRSDYSMCDNTEDGAGAAADQQEDYLDMIRMYMSRVSMEGSVVDADDDEEEERQSFDNDNDVASEKETVDGVTPSVISISDAGKHDEPGCYSLPVTPKQRSSAFNCDIIVRPIDVAKLYASENEADLRKDGGLKRASKKNRRNSRRRILREKWLRRAWEKKKKKKKKDRVVCDDDMNYYNEDRSRYGHRSGGEFGNDEHYRHQLMVITRPCGGGRSLCMDFEEVKACRDLGFELEHESTTFEFSSRHSGRGGSTMDTASAGSDGTSTVTNWRISSPGDDPKDVKARLKVWAQAVALASASQSRLLS
ncbi:hypothetical protein MKW94_029959 [Papaver nudicaule]|uniref:Uncharacterized protein n=1 Tax=Papaver nudicaule TaxID=74823 RepID=A0AA41VN75_PAPNU|nr:hypothetical protein [Papaver nudicaule]